MRLSVLLLLAACGGGSAPEAAAPAAPAAPEAAPAAAPAAPAAPSLKVVSVTSGDAACYVELGKSDGTTQTYPSDFELCPGGAHDATPLIGKLVTPTFEKTQIIADSCQGDPECKDHQEVEGVKALTAAGG